MENISRTTVVEEAGEKVEEEEFTEEQIVKYLKERGQYCPYCGSKNTNSTWSGSTWEGQDLGMRCRDCGKIWKEVYVLELASLEKDDNDQDEERKVSNT